MNNKDHHSLELNNYTNRSPKKKKYRANSTAHLPETGFPCLFDRRPRTAITPERRLFTKKKVTTTSQRNSTIAHPQHISIEEPLDHSLRSSHRSSSSIPSVLPPWPSPPRFSRRPLTKATPLPFTASIPFSTVRPPSLPFPLPYSPSPSFPFSFHFFFSPPSSPRFFSFFFLTSSALPLCFCFPVLPSTSLSVVSSSAFHLFSINIGPSCLRLISSRFSLSRSLAWLLSFFSFHLFSSFHSSPSPPPPLSLLFLLCRQV